MRVRSDVVLEPLPFQSGQLPGIHQYTRQIGDIRSRATIPSILVGSSSQCIPRSCVRVEVMHATSMLSTYLNIRIPAATSLKGGMMGRM